jgi:predicted RNase H-like nuclease
VDDNCISQCWCLPTKKKAGDNRREQATCLDDIIGVNKKYFFSFPAGVARKEYKESENQAFEQNKNDVSVQCWRVVIKVKGETKKNRKIIKSMPQVPKITEDRV